MSHIIIIIMVSYIVIQMFKLNLDVFRYYHGNNEVILIWVGALAMPL